MRHSSGTTVLVTGGEHFGGLAAVRALTLAGHATWVTASADRSYAAFSRLPAGTIRVPDPGAGEDEYVRAVVAATERVGAQVVLPGTDIELAALAARTTWFPPGVAVGVGTPEQVERATAKPSLIELAAVAGFETPPTQILERADVERVEGPFPMVVKPLRSDSEGPDGVLVHGTARRVDDPAALSRVIDQLGGEAWVIQPYLAGELVAVGGVAADGKVIAAVHQVSRRIWPTDCGGSSYAMTIAPDAVREERIARLLGEIGWSGLFQVQLLKDDAGEFLIDLNPRLYGTLTLALAAGVNLPALWVDLLLGGTPPPRPGYRAGTRFRAQWKDARALAAIGRDGSLGEALRGLAPRLRTTHPVFSWSDPLPLLAGSTRVVRNVASKAAVRYHQTASNHAENRP